MANFCDIAIWSSILLLLVISVPTAPERNVKQSMKGCHSGKCGNFSYDEVMRLYPNLLHTNAELIRLKQFHTRNNTSLLTTGIYPGISHVFQVRNDADYCCPTVLNYIINSTITDIDGVTRSIIHLADAVPPRYQFIPEASCLVPGICPGKCLAEESIITLLVMNFIQNTLQFDQFAVPAYCSCKNVLI